MVTIAGLLSGPDKWTVGAFARNAKGGAAHLDCPTATCFCLLGAGSRAALDNDLSPVLYTIAISKAINELFPALGCQRTIPEFNDSTLTTFDAIHKVAVRADELVELELAIRAANAS